MAQTGTQRIKAVFMGTPDFAAASLRHLLESEEVCEVLAIYTQPDRPCGRGRTCKPSAVKTLALEHGLPVFQPEHFKEDDQIAPLKALQPDVFLVAAYGLILPQRVLDIARLGALNVHASLLPEYRGAAPIHRAILDGRHVTGITIMRMEAGLDCGDILLQRSLAIGINDTTEILHDQLAEMGGRLLVDALKKMHCGGLVRIPQDHNRATYAAKLQKSEGLLDWNRAALQVHNQIRALHPWPGSWFDWQNQAGKTLRLGVYPGRVGEPLPHGARAGDIVGISGDNIQIACRDRLYLLPHIKPQNGKPLTGRQFYCGYLSRCKTEELCAETDCNQEIQEP